MLFLVHNRSLAALAYRVRCIVERYRIESLVLALTSLCLLASLVWLGAAQRLYESEQEKAVALAGSNPGSQTNAPGRTPQRAQLQSFDNTRFIGILNGAASDAGFSLEEVALSMDEAPALPFLRYRASFNATAMYSGIRTFTAHVLAASPDITLDAVSCLREEVSSAVLTCSFMFSEAYAKGNRG